MIGTWGSIFQESLREIGSGTAVFVPKLIFAVVIFILGWAFGNIVERVVDQIVKAVKIDNILRSTKLDVVLGRAGFNLNTGKFLGGLVKWFVIVVFLVASLDVLGLDQVNVFLQQVVLLYLPRVFVAVLILLAAAVIAEFLEKVVIGAAKAADIRSAHFVGRATYWAVWVFAVLMALDTLAILQEYAQTFFTGVIVAVSLALGLSFGLGGQEAAARFIDKVKGDIHHHQS